MKALLIGDLTVSVAANALRLPRPGENFLLSNPMVLPSGVAANISSNLSGLGVDICVSGAVGSDVFAEVIIRELRSWGVETRYIERSRIPTGVFLIIVDRTGERTMIGYRGASETLRLNPHIVEDEEPDWVHVSGYTLLNQGQEKALKPFMKATKRFVSIDLEGVAYRTSSLALEGISYAFCNLEEYKAYFGAKDTRVIAPLPPRSFAVVVKAGSRGSYLIGRDGSLQSFKAFKTKVKDTNGAGDAFNAAFIFARLSGLSEVEACRWGNACASLKVSRAGPHPTVTKGKIESLLSEKKAH